MWYLLHICCNLATLVNPFFRPVTEATAAEINQDLVFAFIEVSVVYRFCYMPSLTVLKSCMILSRSSIAVLCFGRDL